MKRREKEREKENEGARLQRKWSCYSGITQHWHLPPPTTTTLAIISTRTFPSLLGQDPPVATALAATSGEEDPPPPQKSCCNIEEVSLLGDGPQEYQQLGGEPEGHHRESPPTNRHWSVEVIVLLILVTQGNLAFIRQYYTDFMVILTVFITKGCREA